MLRPAERAFLQPLARLSYGNPFLPERIDCERQALGSAYAKTPTPWNLWPGHELDDPNILALRKRAEAMAEKLRDRLLQSDAKPSAEDLQLYEDLVLFLLYYRYSTAFSEQIRAASEASDKPVRAAFYDDFRRDAGHYLGLPGRALPAHRELPHVFACCYQIRRAFHHIFYFIVGSSKPTACLRAAVWQSIFSHDLRRYRQTLHARMADFATLITGPSGTGKELVARAIGFARYIPFRAQSREFTEDFYGSFQELNLTALSPNLIESELFGHRRGAFTGAVSDRQGWFETCPPLGTVFLDEIGDLDPTIQLKLLRVLQNRTFQRAGETRTRRFRGKVITATHRDLATAMHAGDFREDLYYRLCSDMIEVPSLIARLRDDPNELSYLLRFIARRELSDDAEALAAEVETWISERLGPDYPWPGNVRELEQCLRNVLIRHEYRPQSLPVEDARGQVAATMLQGSLTADEMLRAYITLVHSQTGNYQETARRLGLDRRTVKSRVDPRLAQRLRTGE